MDESLRLSCALATAWRVRSAYSVNRESLSRLRLFTIYVALSAGRRVA